MAIVNLQEIGQRIAIRRKQLGYTQEQMAGMMDVSIQMISNLERGIKSIRIENLINLCEILNVSTDYILTGRQTYQDSYHLAEQIAELSTEHRKTVEVLVNHFQSYCEGP